MLFKARKEKIYNFYLGQKPNSNGRYIQEIWEWDFQTLEETHNYIQWLFPLKKRSGFNFFAPVLDDEQISKLKQSDEILKNMITSFKVMLQFYGFQIIQSQYDCINIIKSIDYEQRKKAWLHKNNHNYLRITRMLSCLSVLGLDQYAMAFFEALEDIYKTESIEIGNKTFSYWKNSMRC